MVFKAIMRHNKRRYTTLLGRRLIKKKEKIRRVHRNKYNEIIMVVEMI
jgi:hypothetical protein